MEQFSNKQAFRTDRLSKIFAVKTSDVQVLKEVNITIDNGDFVVITGPSGCGKSTLLHILLGLEKPSTGNVYFYGHDLYQNFNEDERTQIRKTFIGMIYQQPNWIKSLTVIENVMFGLRINGIKESVARKKAEETLEMVSMINWMNYKPTELSSGQQQKVALARAVIINPSVIIADEPTGNLDFKSGEELMLLLKSMHEKGKTIIMVTHDLEYFSYATRSVIMFDGKITEGTNRPDLIKRLQDLKGLFEEVYNR